MFRGTQNSTHLLIHTPLNGCGTQVNETENALIFWNEIQVDAVVIDYVITRTHTIRLPFYCSYSRRKMLSLSFKPRNIYIGEEGNVSKHLQNWLLANQLSLNVLKTKYMHLASGYNLSNLGIFAIDPLKIGEQPITRVQSTKSLGVAFDQRLVWEEHVDSLCKRVSSGLAKNLTARLQKLQNRAARIITRKGYDERSSDIRKELRWDDLETIRKKRLAIVLYKVVNIKAPCYLISLFEKGNSGYALRESDSRLLLPKYNTEFANSSSFSFVGAKIWNTIPYHIRTAPTLSAFKKQINNLAVI